MSINITFQAYIPKNLGKTLYELNTDLIDKSLLNYDDFVRKLKSFDTRPYRWIVEPGNLMNRLFCSTDTEDFHSRHTTLHTSRLGFTLNIDLHKIGKYNSSYDVLKHNTWCDGKISNQHSAFSHRVKIYKKYTTLGKAVGCIEEFEAKQSEEKPLFCSLNNSISANARDFNVSEIRILASAGYPYTPNFITPNIDFDIRLKLERVGDNLNIECFGKHNLFPYYELFTNHKTLYTFSPTADGPGIYNLKASTTFHFEKTLFL